jgi:gliding motility-associated-like protein
MPGTTYLGAYGGNSGVDWLDYQSIYFDACSNTNTPPVPSITNCDTVKVCSLNDTVLFNMQFLSPEPGQTTSITYNLGGIPGFSCTSNIPGNTAAATFQFIGTPLNYGVNSITITGTDNGTPVGVSTVTVYIDVDTSLASTLNPIVSGTLSFCTGDSTQLSVTPTTYDAYLWSNGPTTTTDWVNATGTYSVTCWFNGCQKTKTVHVTENPLPTPLITGNSITSCGTGTTTLSSDSLIYTTYLWSNGSPTSSIVVGAGTYTLTVTDANGCTSATAPFNVTSAPPPTIVAHNDTLFCNGGLANLWVDFTGPTIPPVCQLSTTGGCSGGSSTATIGTGLASNSSFSYPAPFGNFYTSMVTQFLYTASELNAAGVTGGKIDQLSWDVIANIGITTYHEFTVKMGCTNLTNLPGVYQTGLFTVYPSSTYNVTMGWNAIPFTTAFEWDGVSNIIVEVCFAEFTSPCLSNWTDNAQTNYTTTTYTSSQWWLNDCNDQCSSPTGFLGTGLMHPDMKLDWCSLAHNPADYSYLWTAFPGPGGIANDTLQTTTASPTAATTIYQVSVVAHAGGCAAVDSVTVNQINLSTMHITPAGPYCLASPCDTLQVSVPIGTGAFHGAGITDTTLGIFCPALAGLGSHVIHYTVASSFCGTADTTITILVANSLDPTITYVGHVCNSWAPFNMTAASPGGGWSGTGITDTLTGRFDPGVAGIGPHTITYTIHVPCYSQDTAIVTVDQQLFATIDTVHPICINAAPITLTSSGAGGTWTGTGITSATAGTFSPSVAGPGPHIITHYFNQLCGDTATTTIIVVPLPVVTAIAPDSGCAPLTVPFQSTTNQPGGTFFWDFGDGHTSTLQNPTETYVSFNGGLPYTVTFTYTDTVGCASTIVHPGMVHVFSQPVAIFSATPQPTDITAPQIQFIDHSTGVVNTWIWTFGTGDGSSLQNPSYTYADTGHYYVQLVVINNNGCTDTTNGMIVIDPITTCYIPSAFTPNGNGDNEVFKVYASDILKDDFTLSIYNRWGEKLFESNDYNIGWNGAKNNSGEVVELGVYVYKVHLRDWKGLGHDYIGHVTLLK